MRLNWGTSIVIAFALFMSFILYFVLKVQGNPEYDNELVVEEYYKKDARYGEEMQKFQNASELSEKPEISTTADGILITFPTSFESSKTTGTVSLYRASSKGLDFKTALKLNAGTQLIPRGDFAGGLWDITIEWTYGDKEFMIKKDLYIK